jgi:hypothetical protein
MARSNGKTNFFFSVGETTHFDTAHGNGFGAWSKMWARTTAALFGADAGSWVLANADDPSRLVVRHRTTGEVRTVEVVEVSR